MRRNFNNWKVENVFQKQKIEEKKQIEGKNKNFRDQGVQNRKLDSHEETEEYTCMQHNAKTHVVVDKPIGV
mgnify:CR=1 FL=1